MKIEIESRIQQDHSEKLDELKAKQENDRLELENSHFNEFQDFNSQWENSLQEHRDRANDLISIMLEKQKNDRMQHEETLEKQIPQQLKKSSELLNMIQIEKGLLKVKEYGEAHKVQQRINRLQKEETEVWENERRKKIANCLAHLDAKHANDLAALKKRLNATEDEMKKKRCLNTEMLLQKFQNVKKELQNYQVQEINKFTMHRVS